MPGEAVGAAFVHAYLDASLNDARFLYAEVALSAGEPTVSYHVDPPGDLPGRLRPNSVSWASAGVW